jgi:hypothetical protein
MKVLAKAKKMKRYSDGGPVDDGSALEAANNSSDSQDIASSMSAGERNTESDTSSKAAEASKPEYKSFKEAFAAERKAGNKTFEYMGKKYTTDVTARTEARDTGSDVARKAASHPKPALRAETQRDRAEAYVAKRAAARAEEAAADKSPKGQDRILTGIKKNAGENKLMGSVKLANGGVVRRATVKSHGKAC